ncbi:hypothetical protein J1605_020629 [Eschrichtius robustus]|uniref:Uncharacterized protein n=1 Tax=Eschrichtius robustus TaxID=9764 RepID=A0AB34HK06_ESCRO|nr:hypothetical protein J1605_020629 [Eschrichtius robustus]
MELSMKKFTVRRFFSVYLRKKSRSKSSSLSRLEVNALASERAGLAPFARMTAPVRHLAGMVIFLFLILPVTLGSENALQCRSWSRGIQSSGCF